MKEETQYKIATIVEKILNRTTKKEFPKLNTNKIAWFYTKILNWTLNTTSLIILIITMTWYFPTYYHTKTETTIIILLCIIIFELKK